MKIKVLFDDVVQWEREVVVSQPIPPVVPPVTPPIPPVIPPVVPPVTPPTQTWTKIASEGQPFSVQGTKTVRYGAGSKWIEKVVTGSGMCTNVFFGSDPVPFVLKECQVSSDTPPLGQFLPRPIQARMIPLFQP